MRLVSILLLIILTFAVLSPATILNPCAKSEETMIQDLDVCHTAAHLINPELPYISACPCTPRPLLLTGICELYPDVINPLVPTFQDERPPKV
jgi:hypothetical protein